MNDADALAKLSPHQLDSLIEMKRSDIEALENTLKSRKLELQAMELLKKKILFTRRDRLWAEILEFVAAYSGELSALLAKAEFVSLVRDKLKIKAEVEIGDELHFHKGTIEECLGQQFQMSIQLEVISDV